MRGPAATSSGGVAAKQAAIRAVYAQVAAPDWAAPNLDGLTDVLRDLSWLPPGPVLVELPDLGALADEDRRALWRVLAQAAEQSVGQPRPVVLSGGGA